MRLPLRWILGLGFAFEILRAVGGAVLRTLKDWRGIHIFPDWRGIHIFLQNMPRGLKGARFRVDRMERHTTTKGEDR